MKAVGGTPDIPPAGMPRRATASSRALGVIFAQSSRHRGIAGRPMLSKPLLRATALLELNR